MLVSSIVSIEVKLFSPVKCGRLMPYHVYFDEINITKITERESVDVALFIS